MEYKDYYKILGVEQDADEKAIKRAFRKLAAKYHPDKGGDEAKFKEINEAYEVLSDPEKRKLYDQFGSNWQQGQPFDPSQFEEIFGGGFGGFGAGGGAQGFSDFFETLFGGGFRQGGGRAHGGFRARGQDQVIKILIPLEDAVNGAERTLNLQVPEADAFGRVTQRNKQIRVKIPAGIKPGQRIRLAGQGGPGIGGGPNGDLYLEVELQKHPLYRVEGDDVYLDLPITPWEAALGAKVEVPTLKGKVALKIPPGAQSGKKLRLKGRGLGKIPGDQYVVLQIHTPPADTEEKKAFYEEMAKKMPFNPRSHF
ncbi:MAG TPA: J domain-containing protein [Sulfurivirga caldicuralii]|nr:J domain-containing protein [Sulfurivirga caldicuralii]